MIAIDTDLVVRYLTGDHPEQSSRARDIIDGQAIFVAVTAVLEAEWVLRSVYGYSRSEVARALRAFGGLSTVTIEDSAVVALAFDLAENGMDFADALHLTKAAHCEAFVTFDRIFLKAAQAAGFETVREA
ncbi:VapC toxin family PIN domain ribonuclease [Rhizobium leguminosarum]|uniref:VapC toxin family PIN domain ribonuclease n=1 Tax=Rhizobium leguminosarum TaxID=384 RepID=A0A4Q1U997_RHILE|nr:type II toxin-antitoxin system VapC family toxin [Rhizobium leguminosarum]RXT27993.1 VapC toxin family PIN domain ribonuclease [Rhizobium leguminosarum]